MAGTLHHDISIPATLSFDTGGRQTAVVLRVGDACVNAGTFTPHTEGPTMVPGSHEERHALVFDPPGHPTVIRSASGTHLVERYATRVITAGIWVLDTYADLVGDAFYCAVEAVHGRTEKAFVVAAMVAAECRGAFGGKYVIHREGRMAGSLHQEARGGNGRMLDYYPAMLVGKRGRWAAPSAGGGRVLRLPHDGVKRNGKVVRVNDHEQAAFDDAFYLHTDPDSHEWAAAVKAAQAA